MSNSRNRLKPLGQEWQCSQRQLSWEQLESRCLFNGQTIEGMEFVPAQVAPQYLVKHTPRLQLGDSPLAPYPGSQFDQVDILWQTVPIGVGTDDWFSVEFRPVAVPDERWLKVELGVPIATGSGGRTMHWARLEKLQYDTEYEYRVRHLRGEMILNSYHHTFHTRLPVGSDASFSFAAYGDSAYLRNIRPFQSVQTRINVSPSAFAIVLGDNIYDRGRYEEADARFDPLVNRAATEWIASHIDYAAIGNHEIILTDGKPFRDMFSNPVPVAGVTASVQPPTTEPSEHNYSFDYGNVHFATFSTNSLHDPDRLDGQLRWIEADMAASNATWKIVFGHHPVAFVPDKAESPRDNYYQQLVPRLRAVGVDVFLAGHSHTFSWTKPLVGQVNGDATYVDDGDKIYRKGSGLIQVVSGVGGRSLRPGSYSGSGQQAVAAGFTTQTQPPVEFGFAQFDVSPRALNVSYVSAVDGRVIDSFSILGNESNTLVFQQRQNGYHDTLDTTLREHRPFTNHSVDPFLTLARKQGEAGNSQALLRFENIVGSGLNQIPPGADIASAVLELYLPSGVGSVSLHRMNRAWSDTATWTSLDRGILPDGVVATERADAISQSVGGQLTFDVTSSVRAWSLDPSVNHGWALIPDDQTDALVYSAEGLIPPRLFVEFTSSEASELTASIEGIDPQSRTQKVDEIIVRFNRPVTGVDLDDFVLTLGNGEPLPMNSAALDTVDRSAWTLSGLAEVINQAGNYELRLYSHGSGISDQSGQALARDAVFAWTDERAPGDANLDGHFGPLDIVQVLQIGKYFNGQPALWGEGDWTGDGLFDRLDIVAALQAGGYRRRE